jgi:hypothetical protein
MALSLGAVWTDTFYNIHQKHGSSMLYSVMWNECQSSGGQRFIVSHISSEGTAAAQMDCCDCAVYGQTEIQSGPGLYEDLLQTFYEERLFTGFKETSAA